MRNWFVTTIGVAAVAGWLGLAPALATLVAVNPTSDHPGATVKVAGKGFGANEAVDIYFDTTDELLVVTNASGSFGNHNLPVPSSATPSQHWVTGVGRHSGLAAQAQFTVDTPWAQFRFDHKEKSNNPWENVLSNQDVSNLDTAWTSSISLDFASLNASPVVANGIVYVADYLAGALDAFDASSGVLLWQFFLYGFAQSPPAVANGVVYVADLDWLYAVNASTGVQIWKYEVGGATTPLTVADGLVFFGYYEYVDAVNASTGLQQWRSAAQTGGTVNSSPVVANGIVYVGSADSNVYAFDEYNGSELWQEPTDVAVRGSPAVWSGVVYAASGDGILYAFNATTGQQIYATSFTTYAVEGSVAVANGVIYVGAGDDNFYALDARNGTYLWSFASGSNVESTAAVANNVVYVGSDDGNLYAFDASCRDCNGPLWIGTTAGPFGSTSPAVSNGYVYVASSPAGSNFGEVYAYALNGGNARVYKSRHAAPKTSSLQPDWRLKPSR